MKEIRNKTHEPLRVPLPQGKTLHLGPLQTGEIGANAVDHPPFQKLVEDGKIELLGEGEPDHKNPFKEDRVLDD